MNPAAGSCEESLRSALNKAELEALEALKLQYFQNATKFLAKGEYDSALAEIKRVLLIDPDHRLAREYEVRVAELQAARAQAPKADPPPVREDMRAPAPAPVQTTKPAPARTSRKSWLYIALIALLLVGTAGVLTLEKVEEEEAPMATVPAASSPQVSAPVEQAAEVTAETTTEEPTPEVQVALNVEPKQTADVAEKSVSRPEPVRKEPAERVSAAPPRPSKSTTVQRSGSAGIGLLAAVTEKKAEPPSAPVKIEAPAPVPEIKTTATQPPPSEPVKESAPFVAIEREPKLIRLEKVRLPDITARDHMKGEVKAKVLVDKQGKPQQIEIVSSTNGFFDQPVINALQNSTFEPGVMGTETVSAWLLIPFKFK